MGCANFGYDELGCLKQVKETLRESGSCGAGDATVVEIGWLVGERFVNQITVCHDKAAQNTLYTIDGIDGAHIAADDKTNTRLESKKKSIALSNEWDDLTFQQLDCFHFYPQVKGFS